MMQCTTLITFLAFDWQRPRNIAPCLDLAHASRLTYRLLCAAGQARTPPVLHACLILRATSPGRATIGARNLRVSSASSRFRFNTNHARNLPRGRARRAELGLSSGLWSTHRCARMVALTRMSPLRMSCPSDTAGGKGGRRAVASSSQLESSAAVGENILEAVRMPPPSAGAGEASPPSAQMMPCAHHRALGPTTMLDQVTLTLARISLRSCEPPHPEHRASPPPSSATPGSPAAVNITLPTQAVSP
ncbi:hypothetical protein B0H10DRAFT_1229006 [Mycena sp. CBHHK59/15]|nr:hypothetical protein B0H10DRAFT_1229006 [Mycena sp. CBHHK59/15]